MPSPPDLPVDCRRGLRTRRAHRIFALCVVAQLLIWLVTGMLFHVKYRYAEAYEPLGVPPAATAVRDLVTTPAEAADIMGEGSERIVLLHDWRGYIYAAPGSAGLPLLVDAASGAPVPLLDEAAARALWSRAVERSAHRHRYGDVVSVSRGEAFSDALGALGPAWELRLTTGQRVTMGAATGEIAHTGPLHRFIDWSYRFHYLQYTPWKGVNVAIVLGWIALTLALIGSGLTLLVSGGARRQGGRMLG